MVPVITLILFLRPQRTLGAVALAVALFVISFAGPHRSSLAGKWWRGETFIGYEGNTGGPWCQDPPACTIYASPYHLHFETRHNGTGGGNC